MEKALKVSQFVSNAVDASGKSHSQIAEELGYSNAKVIDMIKAGSTKLPVNKVRALAQAVGADPKALMSCVLEEYMPESWQEIQRVYGLSEQPQ